MPTVEVFCSTWDGIVYLSIHRALTMAVDAGRFASSCLCSKSNCFLSLCSSCCIQLSTFRICVWHKSRAFVCVGPCFPISYIFYDVIFFLYQFMLPCIWRLLHKSNLGLDLEFQVIIRLRKPKYMQYLQYTSKIFRNYKLFLIAATIGWVGIKFRTDIHDSPRMKPNVVGDPWTCKTSKIHIILSCV